MASSTPWKPLVPLLLAVIMWRVSSWKRRASRAVKWPKTLG